MSEREVPRIDTRRDFVRALGSHPPDIFQGVSKVVDMRGRGRGYPNLFIPETIEKGWKSLPGNDERTTVHTVRGYSNHFGLSYPTTTLILEQDGVTLGSQTTYAAFSETMLHPVKTTVLYGYDSQGRVIELGLTIYRQGPRELLVYKQGEGEHPEQALAKKNGELVSILNTIRDVKPTYTVSVGRPSWDYNRADDIAHSLDLRSASTAMPMPIHIFPKVTKNLDMA